MKRFFIILFISTIAFLQQAKAENITAYLSYATFNLPSQPYFETYLSVIGRSIQFVKNSNGKFQGAVNISVSFTQDGVIRKAQKYTLNSPEISDTTKGFDNFVDQQRYLLDAGSYQMNLSIADVNKPGAKAFTATIPVTITVQESLVGISDIQLLESYTKSEKPGVLTKSGFDLVPYVSTLYPDNINSLKFYAEVYNSSKILGADARIIISYFLENADSKAKLAEFGAFSKQAVAEVNPLLSELNIKDLPSGNYNLVMEVRDKDNKIQAEQRCHFQRQARLSAMSLTDLQTINVEKTFVSSITNKDTLYEYMRSLRPISAPSEINFAENQGKARDLKLMQQFFFNFWKSRSPENPEKAWNDYHSEVLKVIREFSTYGLKGYDTDRGRVYLQYGPPDSREVSSIEPTAYPYELWQYNNLYDKSLVLSNPANRQANRRFVFYNPDLVTNKYYLLHSDARGERNNPRWQMELYRRDTQSKDPDHNQAPDHYGNKVDDNFMNPQ